MQVCRGRPSTRAAIRNVLFAADFSEESAHAVNYVRRLHEAYNAKIFVVHVADLFPYSLSQEPSAREKAALIRSQAETRLRDFMLAHAFERNQFETAVLSGEVFQAIESFADTHDIDLIVLGSRGDLGLNRLFLGSTAEEIFRTARCPVLTVGPHALPPRKGALFNQLLFATDLSSHSNAAVPYLEYLLTRNPSARLTLLHVLQHVEHALEQQIGVPAIEVQVTELIAPDLRHQIAGIVVKPGEPDLTIAKTAASIEADLLVLGVRYGGSFLRAATHGFSSITNTVINKAPCPVLTIRSSEPSVDE
jgi:nucleotide-binding universal stress UspA family protein